MPGANIMVIAVDGLRAAALGAYGNTAYPTPALDQFAAESFLFDHCYADATDLASIYRALWTSAHPLSDDTPSAHAIAAPLPRLLSDQGYATTLVTDDRAVVAFPAASQFDECVSLADVAPNRAEDISQTGMARLFAAVCEQILPAAGERDAAEANARRCVWVHTRGLYGPWDAPLELQEPLLEREEGDPTPCDAIDPPNVVVDTKADPDAAFRWSCGYAAQVVVLDACLEGVTGLLDDLPPHDRWLIVLCGVRGFPLGEHGRIGGVDDRLFAEQLHVPLLWRFPDGTGRLARSGELVSHLDLLPTLVDWIGGTEFAGTELSAGLATPHRPWLGREAGRNDALDGLSLLPLMRHAASPWRDALVAASTTGGRSIRTADWSLRSEPIGVTDEQPPARAAAEADAWHRELYVRPDDRWEANDVANLCRDDVEALSALVRGR